MTEPKKLYRNSHDAVLAGVASGLAEYLNVDKTAVRVVFALLVVFTGVFPGVVAYLVMWLIVPAKPADAAPPTPGAPPT